ncbi:unnamed protein product [Diamesa tonsa]
MADLMKKSLLYVMSEKCYDNYFVDFDFLDGACFKALMSKGLGMGIITGSMLVKVPQITKILNNKSADGLSITSILLDLLAITIHMSYSFVSGFPFSAWGDGTFLATQTAIIASLVFFFGHKSAAKAGLFVSLYAALVFLLMGGLTPKEYLWTAQAFNVPILLAGKATQAFANYRNGSTGQLSAVTVVMLFAGSLARIFTSVQETGDKMMIITYCVSTLANAVIVSQLYYYWNKAPVKATAAKPVAAGPTKSKKAKKAD